MRHQPENSDWMGSSAPDSDKESRKTTDQEKSTDQEKNKTKRAAATAHDADPGQAPTVTGAGKASRKRKLEDLNDREDLSERQLSNRNWL